MFQFLKQYSIYIVIALLIIFTLAGFIYDLSNGDASNLGPILPPKKTVPMQPPSLSPTEAEVFCTADVKLCPDGSAVGRVGPNCEFSPCPGEVINCPEDIKTCADGTNVTRQGPKCEFRPCPGE